MEHAHRGKPFGRPAIGLLFLSPVLQMTLLGGEAVAQDRLQLSATSQQGSVVTYSAPLDVREHSLWADRRAGLDLRTLRVEGALRNSGDSPVRIAVFVVPEEAFQELASRHPDGYYQERARARPADDPRNFLTLFWIDIGPSTSADLSEHAPGNPVALQRMMMAGPVRFGLLALSPEGERPVQVESLGSPRRGERTVGSSVSGGEMGYDLRVRSRTGEVSLLESKAFRGGTLFPGDSYFPGDTYFPRNTLFPGDSYFPRTSF